MARVLIVDDDPLLRESLEAWLASDGIEVVAVGDGQQALEALAGGGFDAAMVDMLLPGMNGQRTIEGLRQIDPDLQIVAMSGLLFRETSKGPAQNLQNRTARLGANRALPKPFKPTQAIAAVRACIAAHVRNVAPPKAIDTGP